MLACPKFRFESACGPVPNYEEGDLVVDGRGAWDLSANALCQEAVDGK
jgi:hypothetical protein